MLNLKSIKNSLSTARWDGEYSKGKWRHLNSLDELGHCSILSGYAHFKSAKSIIDIGCGNGALLRLLPKDCTYLGIDLSENALKQAKDMAKENSSLDFVCANFDDYECSKLFDMVIFNEVLYYSRDYKNLIARYINKLMPGGSIAISMYENKRSKKIWEYIEAKFKLENSVTIEFTGNKWRCALISIAKQESMAH